MVQSFRLNGRMRYGPGSARSVRTTEAVRRAIQHSQASLRALSKGYGINQKTVAKWKKRTSVADLPTGPKGLTPYEFICKHWTSEPNRFTLDPIHQVPGLNIIDGSRAPAGANARVEVYLQLVLGKRRDSGPPIAARPVRKHAARQPAAPETYGGGFGVPEGIRTPDLRFRKPLLYPAELPGRVANRVA